VRTTAGGIIPESVQHAGEETVWPEQGVCPETRERRSEVESENDRHTERRVMDNTIEALPAFPHEGPLRTCAPPRPALVESDMA